jgi:hypothetical protein
VAQAGLRVLPRAAKRKLLFAIPARSIPVTRRRWPTATRSTACRWRGSRTWSSTASRSSRRTT